MLLKHADDKRARLAFLATLEQRLPTPEQQQWAREQAFRTRKGWEGEQVSARYLDRCFADSPDHVLLHDLRLRVGHETAQIDHLLLGHRFQCCLLETKHYGGHLHIDARGRFDVYYADGRHFSPELQPLEQSQRHARLLRQGLVALGVAGRWHRSPAFQHVVLLHPHTRADWPTQARWGRNAGILKADQLTPDHPLLAQPQGWWGGLRGWLNQCSRSTLLDWGQRLLAAHQPEDPYRLPDFITPPAHAVPAHRPRQQRHNASH